MFTYYSADTYLATIDLKHMLDTFKVRHEFGPVCPTRSSRTNNGCKDSNYAVPVKITEGAKVGALIVSELITGCL